MLQGIPLRKLISPPSTRATPRTVDEMLSMVAEIRKKPAAAPAVQTAGGKKSGAKATCVNKDGNNLKPRSVHVEMSRKHVLARTGLTTYPRSKCFPFKSVSGMDAAKRKAEAWLKKAGARAAALATAKAAEATAASLACAVKGSDGTCGVKGNGGKSDKKGGYKGSAGQCGPKGTHGSSDTKFGDKGSDGKGGVKGSDGKDDLKGGDHDVSDISSTSLARTETQTPTQNTASRKTQTQNTASRRRRPPKQ